MNKKLVVVIPNELENNIQFFASSCEFNHSDKLREFLYHNDINLYGEECAAGDTISKLLSDQGFLVLLIDDSENLKNIMAYVPEKTSPKQLDYFEKRKEQLIRYTIEFLVKQPNDKYAIKEQSNVDKPIIYVLIDELKTRLMTVEKNKTLTRKPK